MIVLSVILVLLLIVAAGIQPVSAKLSAFEIKRRIKSGRESELEVQRELQARGIIAIKQLAITLLTIAIVLTLTHLLDYLWGSVVSAVVVVAGLGVTSLSLVRKIVAVAYRPIERPLIRLSQRFGSSLTRLDMGLPGSDRPDLHSKEELLALLKVRPSPLSAFESRAVASVLSFESATVRQVMTERADVVTISHDELLGPIALNDLHKTGHRQFPVIDGSLDRVIGILNIADLLTIDGTKNSKKVKDVMSREVETISHESSLRDALPILINATSRLAVVVDSRQQVVGLLTLGRVIETLIGQPIK